MKTDPTELAYIFREINKLGTGERVTVPDLAWKPPPPREPIIPGGELPLPKPNPPAPPPPPAAAPPLDPRLVEIAQRWEQLSERERQELHGLFRLLVYLDTLPAKR